MCILVCAGIYAVHVYLLLCSCHLDCTYVCKYVYAWVFLQMQKSGSSYTYKQAYVVTYMQLVYKTIFYVVHNHGRWSAVQSLPDSVHM